MTWPSFAQQMHRLNGLRFAPADLTTHWEALRDLPDSILEAAVGRAQKTRVEFPTPIELRQDADQVKHLVDVAPPEQERGIDLATPVTYVVPHVNVSLKITREWKYYCQDCSDEGKVSKWCGVITTTHYKPWMAPEICQRTREHFPHEWVTACSCVATNPAIQRRKARDAQYAAERSQAKRGAA